MTSKRTDRRLLRMKRALRPVLTFPPKDMLSQAIQILPELRPDVSNEWFDYFDLDPENRDHRELLLLIFQAIALGTSTKGRKKKADEVFSPKSKWWDLHLSADARRIIRKYPDGSFNKVHLARQIKERFPEKYQHVEIPSIRRHIFEDLKKWSTLSARNKGRIKRIWRLVDSGYA